MPPSRFETLKRFCVEIYEFFLNSPYLIFSGQQHNLQLSLTLEIARWTLAGFFGVSPFVAIEEDERAWGFVLISCQTRHTFARSFILLSSLWLAGEIETRQVVTPGVKMRWRGRQSKTPRIRAGGFSFSRGFAARYRALRARISRLRRSCARLDKTAMLRRLTFKRNRKKFKLSGVRVIEGETRNTYIAITLAKLGLVTALKLSPVGRG